MQISDDILRGFGGKSGQQLYILLIGIIFVCAYLLSPSSRRAWIETLQSGCTPLYRESPSSRRAWIETFLVGSFGSPCLVALLTEGVDRNASLSAHKNSPCVALLTEGVDRNEMSIQAEDLASVALLTEGVDRNNGGTVSITTDDLSPSSRRAWIETSAAWTARRRWTVALLTEGVDRNESDLISFKEAYSRPPHGGRG